MNVDTDSHHSPFVLAGSLPVVGASVLLSTSSAVEEALTAPIVFSSSTAVAAADKAAAASEDADYAVAL